MLSALAISSSGSTVSKVSTVNFLDVAGRVKGVLIPTKRTINVKRLNVPVSLDNSYVARTVASVSLNSDFLHFALLPSAHLYFIFTFWNADIDDFLSEEVKGPGSFSCSAGRGCSFSEPAMNQLINDIFGDKSITLDCESGECLHYTQVPGYVVPEKPDNRSLVALSAAAAAVIFILACICK